MSSCFTSDELQEIKLDNGHIVRVKKSISYEAFRKIFNSSKEDTTELAMPLFKEVVKEWDFTNDNGEIPEVNEENMGKLDALIVVEMIGKIAPLYTLEKKTEKESEEE